MEGTESENYEKALINPLNSPHLQQYKSRPTRVMIDELQENRIVLWISGYFRHHRGPYAVVGPPLHHYPRYRRSVTPEEFKPEDLMAAWEELEKASGRKLKFDEASCAKAGKMGRKELPLWVKILQSEFTSRYRTKHSLKWYATDSLREDCIEMINYYAFQVKRYGILNTCECTHWSNDWGSVSMSVPKNYNR